MSLTLWKRRSERFNKPGNLTRPISQWEQILRDQTDGSATEFAARIFGDLHCYRAETGGTVRTQFYDDVHQLAAALEAYANRNVEPQDIPEVGEEWFSRARLVKPRDDSTDRVMMMALSTMGALTFFESLSRVCSKIALACGVTTEAEKETREAWVGLSVRADVCAQNMERANLTSPFVWKEPG